MRRAIPIIAVLATCLVPYFPAWAQDRVVPQPLGSSSSPPAQDANYQFGPEDVLQIHAWGKPELSGTVTVDYSGQIQIPLVGDLPAAGRTPAQLSHDLTERFQLLDPSVSEVVVWVAEYKSRSVTVVGEVRNPGQYGFREMPDLWEAILTAGGPTEKAELGRVQVIRQERTKGEPYTVTVDLSRGIEKTPPESLPKLQPHDRILVPSSEAVPIGGDNVNVIGQVNSPGVFRINAAHNVVEALTVSGGPKEEADLRKVYLTRVNESGVMSYELDIEGYLRKGTPLSNLDLQAGDTITVVKRSSWYAAVVDGVSQLIPFASLAIAYLLATK